MGYNWKWTFLSVFLFFTGCGGDNVSPPLPPSVSTGGNPPYTGETCMSAQAMLLGTSGAFLLDAADFDGTNDYMLRGADLTGIADGKSGMLSFWYRVDGGNGALRYILENSSFGFQLVQSVDNKFYLYGENSASTLIMEMNSSAHVAGASWLHILAAWDLAAGVQQLYVADVSDVVVSVNTNDTIDYAGSVNWSVGAQPDGTFKASGCLAEFYFAPNQYLDFSDVNNRRKFISAAGKPVHLGVDGSLPTGTAPIVYLHLSDGEAVANFATNRGTGGNFTITGTLDTATTSPNE